MKTKRRIIGLILAIISIATVIVLSRIDSSDNKGTNIVVSTSNTEEGSADNKTVAVIPKENDKEPENKESQENDKKQDDDKLQENNKKQDSDKVQVNNKSEEDSKETKNISSIKSSKIIVIDPGHQLKGNSEKEPIGPNSTETKAKVTGGAVGTATGQTEYQLNLDVSLKLRDVLESKGYTVIMTRTTNNVNISNSERAKIANDANANAFIRIHANSSDDSSIKGVLTMCQTSNNKYNGNLASESYKLSKSVLDSFVEETGAKNKGVTRTDTMSGINWCTVPTTIVEMGFLSNADEDKLMSTEAYQNKMVNGIVKGIEFFLEINS